MKYFILFLFLTTSLFAEPKLCEPVETAYFYSLFYGEQETVTQEGTYSNIYANYEERYILYDLNVFRLKPSELPNEDSNTVYAHCITWGDANCYPAVKPLYYNVNLSRAGRYHCDDMIVNNCFEHNDCDGGNIWERIKRYYTSSRMGENIAAGHGYVAVTKNLINEVGASPGTDGHRNNVFSADFNEVGIGYLEGGEYRNYLTQDFGASGTYHAIPAAIHTPKSPANGSSVVFKAIYHNNTTNAAAKKAYLILNNTCYSLIKTISTSETNWFSGEYKTEINIPSGCKNYSFQFIANDNSVYRYPDQGQLIVGANCDLYTATNATVDCENVVVNPCNPNPCRESHKTVCTNVNEAAVCSCESGYYDDNGTCKIQTVCDPNPCTEANKTRCSENGNTYLCECNYGYHIEGNSCVVDTTNVCLPNPCTEMYKTLCRAENGVGVCYCDAGYVLSNGQCVTGGGSIAAPEGCNFGTTEFQSLWLVIIAFMFIFIKKLKRINN